MHLILTHLLLTRNILLCKNISHKFTFHYKLCMLLNTFNGTHNIVLHHMNLFLIVSLAYNIHLNFKTDQSSFQSYMNTICIKKKQCVPLVFVRQNECSIPKRGFTFIFTISLVILRYWNVYI